MGKFLRQTHQSLQQMIWGKDKRWGGERNEMVQSLTIYWIFDGVLKKSGCVKGTAVIGNGLYFRDAN